MANVLLRLNKKLAEYQALADKYAAAIALIEDELGSGPAEKKVRQALKGNAKGVQDRVLEVLRTQDPMTRDGMVEEVQQHMPLGKHPARVIGLALANLQRSKMAKQSPDGTWRVLTKGKK